LFTLPCVSAKLAWKDKISIRGKTANVYPINDKAYLTTSQKVLFMAVIPEVLNRESILFKKLRAPGFPPSRE
jgi:hypothetical protein